MVLSDANGITAMALPSGRLPLRIIATKASAEAYRGITLPSPGASRAAAGVSGGAPAILPPSKFSPWQPMHIWAPWRPCSVLKPSTTRAEGGRRWSILVAAPGMAPSHKERHAGAAY